MILIWCFLIATIIAFAGRSPIVGTVFLVASAAMIVIELGKGR